MTVAYEKNIQWVISTGYEGKHVINRNQQIKWLSVFFLFFLSEICNEPRKYKIQINSNVSTLEMVT